MRMAIQVAKAELRNLFYSPVAWFLLIVFLAQCAYFYTTVLYGSANWQDQFIKNNPNFKEWDNEGFTRILFLGQDGFFTNVLRNLYLFIPLLTMGIIGKEVQSGTVKLLYSSPVKLWEIVWGKFLAIMVYNIMLVLVVGIFLTTAAFNTRSVDYGMLLSAALGFYLLTCAYAAIGIFLSSLTTYQIVAALGTFLIIAGLTFVSGLGQQYDFVRDLTYFLHLAGRAEKMLVGLITTKDVIYFLVVIVMFLVFTLLKLRDAREIKPWYVKATRYMGVVVVALLIGYASSRPALTGYWDTTQQDVNTIHPKTQALIKELGEEPLEVTLYTNMLGDGGSAGLPVGRNAYLHGLWEQYLRFKPDIAFKYEYYYDFDSTIQASNIYQNFPGKSLDYIAGKLAGYQELDIEDFQKPEAFRKKIDLRPEGLRLVMQLKYKGRTEFLRTFNDNFFWPDEKQVAAAFKRLLYPDFPRLAFITGHYERSAVKKGEREFGNLLMRKSEREALVNLGFNMDTITLDAKDIPENISTLVLADPKAELSEVCKQKISQYINKGGNMFIFGEPGKQQMVNPVLKQIGAHLLDGILVQESKQGAPDMLTPYFTNKMISLIKDPVSSEFKKVPPKHVHTLMEGATAVVAADTAGFRVVQLARAEESSSWLKKGVLIRDSTKPVFNAAEGDMRGMLISKPAPAKVEKKGHREGEDSDTEFATMLALHRNINSKDQRIIIAGDADFLSNVRKGNAVKYGPFLYSWLSNGTYPILMPRPSPPDTILTITGKTAQVLGIIYVWILPGLLLLAATILLIRRKRK